MRLEVADIGGDRASVLAAVPVDGDKRDGAAGALFEKRGKPVESLGDTGAVRAGAVGDTRGAEQHVVARVLLHILVEGCDGGADVHVRLALVIGFVERHEVVGPGARGCGFDG